MTKESITNITTTVYIALSALDKAERQRVLSAVLALLGDELPKAASTGDHSAGGGGQRTSNEATEKSFFDEKKPSSKIEELAVAARYRELHQDADKHEKTDLEQVIKSSRRNFDSKNFSRDLDNAKNKGLFSRDKDIRLSYTGQEYVDALPNRESLKTLPKPRAKKKAPAKKTEKTTKK